MKLYHYTSYKTFKRIWESQKLLFSDCQRLNDIVEVEKQQLTRSIPIFRELRSRLFDYKQISLTKDFSGSKKGCMSPMLWGHYADKAKGICIELEFSLLTIPNEVIHNDVKYVETKNIINCEEICLTKVSEFVSQNIPEIFFTKLNDWRAENEYRLICNEPSIKGISIEKAVTAIYISSRFHKDRYMSRKCRQLEKLVGKHELVTEFYYIARNGTLTPLIVPDTQKSRELAFQNKKIQQKTIKKIQVWFSSEKPK